MKRLIAVLVAAAVAMLAVPSMASAHGYFAQWDGGQSSGTHNLTVQEAKNICQWVIPSGFHGGVSHFGNVLAFHDGWPYFQEHTIGYRARDNSLMKCRLRETFNYGPSWYELSASHQ